MLLPTVCLLVPPLLPPSYPLQQPQPQPQPPLTRILPLASSGRACPLSSVTSVSSYSILLSSHSHLTLISSQLQRVWVSMQYVFIALSTAPPDIPCPIISTPPTYSPLCHLMLHRLASSPATALSDGKSLPHTRTSLMSLACCVDLLKTLGKLTGTWPSVCYGI